MATIPDKSEISATYPNPSNATARAGFGKLWEALWGAGGLLGTSGSAADACAALGAFNKLGDNMAGAIDESRDSVTGHATDTPIWAAAGNAVEITGTPTITDFPDAPQAGAVRRIFPAAGAVIANNANISVQGGADYTFAAGDWAFVEAITTATFRATIFKADGAAVSVNSTPPVRQTVLYGPVNSDGTPNFGGSTGGTTVTAAGTLSLTSANGKTDHVWDAVNPSWTGLNTNGTMYLYLDETDGAVASTLAPVYQEGGTPSTTSGQFTYNKKEAKAYVGNGSSAVQKYRCCVGQVTVSGGVVSAITWYALRGSFESAATAWTTSANVNWNHHIGLALDQLDATLYISNSSTGPWLPYPLSYSASPYPALGKFGSNATLGISMAPGSSGLFYDNGTNGGNTITSGYAKVSVRRNWQ